MRNYYRNKEHSCKLSNYCNRCIKYYNNKRVHMSLNYITPTPVYKRGVIHVVG